MGETKEKKVSNDKLSFVIRRDKSGEVVPIETASPQLFLKVKLLPLTYGESKRFLSFGEAFDSWSDKEQFELLSEHIVEVNGESFEDIEFDDFMDMEAWVVLDLMQAVALHSGLGRIFDSEESKKALEKALAQT